VVQNGDSVWRIANRFKVNQDALMKANGLSDARKLRGGMSLVIPQ
jgi:LysM repeat protein